MGKHLRQPQAALIVLVVDALCERNEEHWTYRSVQEARKFRVVYDAEEAEAEVVRNADKTGMGYRVGQTSIGQHEPIVVRRIPGFLAAERHQSLATAERPLVRFPPSGKPESGEKRHGGFCHTMQTCRCESSPSFTFLFQGVVMRRFASSSIGFGSRFRWVSTSPATRLRHVPNAIPRPATVATICRSAAENILSDRSKPCARLPVRFILVARSVNDLKGAEP